MKSQIDERIGSRVRFRITFIVGKVNDRFQGMFYFSSRLILGKIEPRTKMLPYSTMIHLVCLNYASSDQKTIFGSTQDLASLRRR